MLCAFVYIKYCYEKGICCRALLRVNTRFECEQNKFWKMEEQTGTKTNMYANNDDKGCKCKKHKCKCMHIISEIYICV